MERLNKSHPITLFLTQITSTRHKFVLKLVSGWINDWCLSHTHTHTHTHTPEDETHTHTLYFLFQGKYLRYIDRLTFYPLCLEDKRYLVIRFGISWVSLYDVATCKKIVSILNSVLLCETEFLQFLNWIRLGFFEYICIFICIYKLHLFWCYLNRVCSWGD